MDHIVRDRSGHLRTGLFYEFGVARGDSYPPYWSDGDLTILSKRQPTSDEVSLKGHEDYMLCESEGAGEREIRHDCDKDQTHVTAEYWTRAKCYLHGGTRLSAFIPDMAEVQSETIVSGAFAEQLKRSGLTGFGLVEAAIVANPTGPIPKGLALFVCNFKGRPCERPPRVRGAPNACPFCGRAPLICQGCGKRLIICPKCEKRTWTTRKDHGGPGDRRLICEPPEQNQSCVLEGQLWDGSDFIYAPTDGFITKRCLDWLLSVHAAPFYALPALVNVEGLSPEQLAKVEGAKNPIVPTKSK